MSSTSAGKHYADKYGKQSGKRVKLPDSDRQRMTRLIEEVYARATEMASIAGRHLDLSAIAPVRQFRLDTKPGTQSSDVDFGGIEVIVNPETGDCMIYDHDTGECIPCADA